MNDDWRILIFDWKKKQEKIERPTSNVGLKRILNDLTRVHRRPSSHKAIMYRLFLIVCVLSNVAATFVPPIQGLKSWWRRDPGRCPGLSNCTPSGFRMSGVNTWVKHAWRVGERGWLDMTCCKET